MENILKPRFMREEISDAVYTQGMLNRARAHPSLFYQCLRYRGWVSSAWNGEGAILG